MSPELTIVIPTLNECDTVAPLVERFQRVLIGLDWEAVFVDDGSTDGTAERLDALERTLVRVRVIHRIGRRGLASACVEGIDSSHAPQIAVIDADLQHDETLLPKMLSRLKQCGVDVIVASRYMTGGRPLALRWHRRWLSRTAARAAQRLLDIRLTDPLSGFFLMRREAFDAARPYLSQKGFKLLLDLIASSPQPVRWIELPCRFVPREHGDSKFGVSAAWQFIVLMAQKRGSRRDRAA